MDKLKLAGILVTLLIASGCSMPNQGNNNSSGGNKGPQLTQNRGLRVINFRSTDETLRPSQPAIINLRLKNYHEADINITDLYLYNEGLLTVENRSCNPSPEDLKPASGNNYPEMHCQWDLKAPSKDKYGFPSSKPTSVNLHLEYESALTNQKPFKVQYKHLDEINSTSNIGKTFKNSEVRMAVSTENPVPLESRRVLHVRTHEVGKGRIASDTDYKFRFSPKTLFDGCARSDAPTVNKELKFKCKLTPPSHSGTRNLLFSTHYKYVKEPVLRMKLVNNQ
ncbi:MAG: hypothetical protein ABEJ87_05965 [Candidatus Nanohalobium sp.]